MSRGARVHLYQAPADAGEFWDRDAGYILNLTRKLLGPGVSSQDAEDAASEIFERLLVSVNKDNQNILAQYSAGFTSARTGKPVTWRGFLAGKVALYVRGKRETLQRRTGRELLICDTQAGDNGERWVEMFGGRVWDDYPSLTDGQFVERMRDYLATVPDSWEGGSLFAVFNEIIERVKSGERTAQVAGLSRKETAVVLMRIRTVLEEAAGEPPPGPMQVAGVVLSPAEIRDALDRLRAAKGNHVHRALAGHRLMLEGEKGWYHGVARAELKLWPECGVDALEGKVGGAGAGHVKEAVMHALARLLAGSPAPEAEPEPEEVSAAEVLESELWRIPGIPWDGPKIEAVLDAARRVYT